MALHGGAGRTWVLGLVSVAFAAAVAELLAALGQWAGWLRTTSSPVDSVGSAFITVTPQWLKRWAIEEFGLHDKQALLTGMALTAGVVAAVIGLLAGRRVGPAAALGGVLAVGVLAVVATRTGSRPVDLLPGLIGAVVGLWLLTKAARLVQRRPTDAAATNGVATNGPATNGAATNGAATNGAATNGAATNGGAGPHPRRQFLRLMGFSTVMATAAALLSRIIPTAADVEASRARIAIPIPQDAQQVSTGASSAPAPTPLPSSSAIPPARQLPTPAVTTSTPSTVDAQGSPTATTPNASTTTVTTPSTSTAPTPSASTTPPSTTVAAVDFPSIPGLSPFVTPSRDFYRIDTALSPPLIRAEDWSLRIHGLVAQEYTLGYLALMALPQVERTITLTCVSNPVGGHLVGNATWIGVRLTTLLQRAGVRTGADCLLATSADGFTSTTPLQAVTDGRDALLAVAMNGAPLPIDHGFPARMVVPGLYGYLSATKWVVDLEVTTFARSTSYWTSRGYAQQAPVKTSSRIDVPAPYTPVAPGDRVTLAGMAWAQHRGISAVQVRIDGGPWQTTELSAPLSTDTWRQWRLVWTATPGRHMITCRAVDGTGQVQDATNRDVLPDGATGYASLVLQVN